MRVCNSAEKKEECICRGVSRCLSLLLPATLDAAAWALALVKRDDACKGDFMAHSGISQLRPMTQQKVPVSCATTTNLAPHCSMLQSSQQLCV